MKKKLKLSVLGFTVHLLIGAMGISCTSEPDCSIAGRAMVGCYIYQSASGTAAHSILNDTLTITGLGTDSIIVNALEKPKNFSLPLRYTNDTTVFVLHYKDKTKDTLSVIHTNKSYFLSMECGYTMKQSVKEIAYTRYKLDSISVTGINTNIDGSENFCLFYKN